MTQIKKSVFALGVAAALIACESDFPELTVINGRQQQNDPVDEDFERQIQDWLDNQEKEERKDVDASDSEPLK